MKALYNTSKDKWMLKYGITRFQSHHIKSVLVETREAFTVSAGNIIRDSFAKTHLHPLTPTNTITNTQACVFSVQISSNGITQIAEYTLAPIQLEVTRTNNPMVIIQAKVSIQQPLRKSSLGSSVRQSEKANCPPYSGYE